VIAVGFSNSPVLTGSMTVRLRDEWVNNLELAVNKLAVLEFERAKALNRVLETASVKKRYCGR
jgi:hypothetical protein